MNVSPSLVKTIKRKDTQRAGIFPVTSYINRFGDYTLNLGREVEPSNYKVTFGNLFSMLTSFL
jgi:hypothetical protein